jgi:hypothetical protein
MEGTMPPTIRRLAAVALLVTAACGLRGASGTPRRRAFYLTTATVQGNQALSACRRGFHMASRFELVDLGLLDYASDLGLTTDDAGYGPPSVAAAYGTPGAIGWVRTGGGSQFTDAAGAPGSAFTNCALWSTNAHQAAGTVAWLTDRFTTPDGGVVPAWTGGSRPCDEAYHVWCVEHRVMRREDERDRRRREAGPPPAP